MTTDEWVERLTAAAAARGVAPSCRITAERAYGEDDQPRLDLAVGATTLTLWPTEDASAWVRARVAPEPAGSPAYTETVGATLDDATVHALVALLLGEGRVVHRRRRADELVAGEGRARLVLPFDDHPRTESGERVGPLTRLRARYRDQLGPLELSFETEPAEAWRFRLDAARSTTVEIDNIGGDLYWLGFEDLPLPLTSLDPSEDGEADEYFEMVDLAGDSLGDFVEACAVKGLVAVRWSAALWRGWWLENGEGVHVSCERRYRRDTWWDRFLSSRPSYTEQRWILREPRPLGGSVRSLT